MQGETAHGGARGGPSVHGSSVLVCPGAGGHARARYGGVPVTTPSAGGSHSVPGDTAGAGMVPVPRASNTAVAAARDGATSAPPRARAMRVRPCTCAHARAAYTLVRDGGGGFGRGSRPRAGGGTAGAHHRRRRLGSGRQRARRCSSRLTSPAVVEAEYLCRAALRSRRVPLQSRSATMQSRSATMQSPSAEPLCDPAESLCRAALPAESRRDAD